jgi:putative transposase
MFAVCRLSVGGWLATTLTNANCIESMISVARTTTGNVKRWQDGRMNKRWVAAWILEAQRSFRVALRRTASIETDTPDNYDQAAA